MAGAVKHHASSRARKKWLQAADACSLPLRHCAHGCSCEHLHEPAHRRLRQSRSHRHRARESAASHPGLIVPVSTSSMSCSSPKAKFMNGSPGPKVVVLPCQRVAGTVRRSTCEGQHNQQKDNATANETASGRCPSAACVHVGRSSTPPAAEARHQSKSAATSCRTNPARWTTRSSRAARAGKRCPGPTE